MLQWSSLINSAGIGCEGGESSSRAGTLPFWVEREQSHITGGLQGMEKLLLWNFHHKKVCCTSFAVSRWGGLIPGRAGDVSGWVIPAQPCLDPAPCCFFLCWDIADTSLSLLQLQRKDCGHQHQTKTAKDVFGASPCWFNKNFYRSYSAVCSKQKKKNTHNKSRNIIS